MATRKEFADFILERLSDLDEIACRMMMGEYIVYYRGKIAAYICDDRLLVKPVAAAREYLPEAVMEPPYAGAKPMLLVSDPHKVNLSELFVAMYDQLPAPKPKKR